MYIVILKKSNLKWSTKVLKFGPKNESNGHGINM